MHIWICELKNRGGDDGSKRSSFCYMTVTECEREGKSPDMSLLRLENESGEVAELKTQRKCFARW